MYRLRHVMHVRFKGLGCGSVASLNVSRAALCASAPIAPHTPPEDGSQAISLELSKSAPIAPHTPPEDGSQAISLESSKSESIDPFIDASGAFLQGYPFIWSAWGVVFGIAGSYFALPLFKSLSNSVVTGFADRITARYLERSVLATPPPDLDVRLDDSIIDQDSKVIWIMYEGCPFYNDVKYTLEMIHSPKMIRGPKSCGKTVFAMALLQGFKDKGHYTVYVACPDKGFKDLVDLVAPQLHVDVPGAKSSRELFIMLLKVQSALGKRVYVVIDDAELLSRDTPGLSFMLNCCSDFGMGLLLSSSRSDPGLTEAKHASGIKTLRFDPGLEPFKVALAEAGLSGADVEAVLEATGPHAGDVVRVMGEYRRSKDLRGAIDSYVDAAYDTIEHAVINVAVRDVVSGGDLTINDACDLLALAVVDNDKAVNLFVRFNDDPAKLKRIIVVGEYMVKVGVLSHGMSRAEFVWGSNMLATAYKMNREKLERMRGRAKGDVAGGDKPTA